MRNSLDTEILDYLRSIPGSTAWAMQGAIGEDRVVISKALQRLKRKGLVKTSDTQHTYWKAVSHD